MRNTIALLVTLALCLGGIAAADEHTTEAEVEKLKEAVKDLEKRVMQAERKKALDRIDFTGDYRFEAHSIDASIPDHFDGMVGWFGRYCAWRDSPDFLGNFPVLCVCHHHICRQPMSECPRFTTRPTRTRLPGEGKRLIAWLADLPGQKVKIVDKVVDPGAAGVLIHPHGPE